MSSENMAAGGVLEWPRTTLVVLICLLLNADSAKGLSDYSVRLVGGSNSLEGRVEVYVDGSWRTICDDSWDLQDATVVCRQLGHGEALEAKSSAFFGEGSGSFVLDDLNCDGTESSLSSCSHWIASKCEHWEDAGVICLGAGESSVRLVDGANALEGRVEVYVDGSWGTVCDDGWDLQDARVVCRQLGYGYALQAKSYAFFGQGIGNVVMGNVNCDGTELGLLSCSRRTYHACTSHSNDAGVICSGQASSAVVAQHVRLVDGGTPNVYQGRVEVFVNGIWGTVCDNDWDIKDAQVACRQLGFDDAISAPGHGYFGEGSIPIVIDNVHCTGTETSLLYCPYSSDVGFGHHHDAGVICADKYAVRLVGGNSHSQGRVEIYLHGSSGTVCVDSWDLRDAKVVCRQLGFTDAVSAVALRRFGQGTGTILFSNVDCVGTESNLLECNPSRVQNCLQHGEAGVICATDIQVGPQIRLVGGSTELEGRVEMYVDGEWGTICDTHWDLADAEVVCRQLGFEAAQSVTGSAAFAAGSGRRAHMYNQVECFGIEDSIQACEHSNLDACHLSDDAGVSCTNVYTGYDFGQLRLVDGLSEFDGYVEIYYKQEWGTICNGNWNMSDADVVCGELGYDYAIATSNPSGYTSGRFGKGPIWLNDLSCYGFESRLIYCDHGQWENNTCSHSADVYVKCKGAPLMSPGGIFGVAFVISITVLLCIIALLYLGKKRWHQMTKRPESTLTTSTSVPAESGDPVVHYRRPQSIMTTVPDGQHPTQSNGKQQVPPSK